MIRIQGKEAGCPIWEITEKDGHYIMANSGIVTGSFDSLRMPLELLSLTFGITPWKDTMVEAVKEIDERNGIRRDDLNDWSASELLKYLAYGDRNAVGVTGNWKPI